jgi:hypothetical protein
MFSVGVPAWPSLSYSTPDLHIDNVPRALPPDVTRNKETIDTTEPDLKCTPIPIKMKTHRKIIGVEHAGGTAYGYACGFYDKHRKYTEECNPCFLS